MLRTCHIAVALESKFGLIRWIACAIPLSPLSPVSLGLQHYFVRAVSDSPAKTGGAIWRNLRLSLSDLSRFLGLGSMSGSCFYSSPVRELSHRRGVNR